MHSEAIFIQYFIQYTKPWTRNSCGWDSVQFCRNWSKIWFLFFWGEPRLKVRQYFMQWGISFATYSETGRPRERGFSLPTGFILSTPPSRLRKSLWISVFKKCLAGDIFTNLGLTSPFCLPFLRTLDASKCTPEIKHASKFISEQVIQTMGLNLWENRGAVRPGEPAGMTWRRPLERWARIQKVVQLHEIPLAWQCQVGL